IWSLRNSRLSISAGIFREAASSTKKARSHSSRKLAIIQHLLQPYVPLSGTLGKRSWAGMKTVARRCRRILSQAQALGAPEPAGAGAEAAIAAATDPAWRM